MKPNSIITVLPVFLATIAITSCNFSTEQKAATSEKAIVEGALQDLEIAREDSTDYANYKIESEKKLRENELLIADMKDKMKSEGNESIMKYIQQLDSLNAQNSQLRKNMHTYSSEGKANLELFKKEFNKKLDELGKSISLLAE